MFQLLFRMLGFFVLALALVLAILDITRSITAEAIIMTSLASSWISINPETLASSRDAVVTLVHPLLWDPVLTNILALPSWLILWFLSMILLWLGQRREARYGRFASR